MTVESGTARYPLSAISILDKAAHVLDSLLTVVIRFVRRKPLGAAGALILVLMVLAAVFADVVSPYDPLVTQPGKRLSAPGGEFWFGSDELGRDVFSRVLHGARTSLYVGLATVLLTSFFGTIIGTASAYFGGKVDLITQRIVDSVMPFPLLVLAMTLVSMLGASRENVIIALAVVITPNNSRVIRGAALSLMKNQYVEGARAIGCGHVRIITRYILPNVAAPVLVLASIQIGSAILTEASLSFLGVGTPPPTPTWGGMVAGAGRVYIERAPWIALFPGIAISAAVYGVNLFGDALRDVLDPRLRGS